MSHTFADHPPGGVDQGAVQDLTPAAASGTAADAIMASLKRLYAYVAGRGFAPCMFEAVEVYAALNTTDVDADFVTLDLSEWVPPGVTVVNLEIGIYSGAASYQKKLAVRAPGDTAGGM